MTKPNTTIYDNTIPTFKYFVQTVLPAVYDDSLSHYELLAKVIKALNDMGVTVNSLIDLWNDVTEWVTGDGLNESVVKRLDELVADGTLATIINQEVFDQLNAQINNIAVDVTNPQFGAKGGMTDDTLAIQSAIDYVSSLGGGKVYLPKFFRISNIKLKSFVTLEGDGYGSGLISIDNNPATRMVEFLDKNQYMITLRNFYIKGNKSKQSKPVTGLYISNGDMNGSTLPSGEGDHHNLFENVYIRDCSGSGFYMDNSSRECRINNVVSRNCDEYGFFIGGTDNHFAFCTSAKSEKHGFYILGSNNLMTSCKAFGSGLNGGTFSDGFVMGYGATGNQLVNCSSQENGRHGFTVIQTTGNVLEGAISDSNSVLVSYGAGINLDTAIKNFITGVVLNRDNLAGAQKYAIQIMGSGSYDNDIILTANGTTTKPLKPHYNGGVVNMANRVRINTVDANIRNTFSNPDLLIDSNNDGMADGLWAKEPNAGITGTLSIDLKEQATKISITANASGSTKKGYIARYEADILASQTLAVALKGKVSNASNLYLTANINWYNGTTYLSTTGTTKVVASTEWDTLIVANAVAPLNCTHCRVDITLVANGASDTGDGWIKDLLIGKTIA